MSAQWTWMTDLVGWTLLHFVWQGTLAALGLGFALSCVPRRWARARYVLACVTLATMAILPVATGTYLAEFSADRNRLAFAGGAVAETDPAVVAARGSSAVRPSSGAREGEHAASATPIASLRYVAQAPPTTWFPWLVAIWLLGVAVCSVRLAGGWWHTRRLVREDAFEADEAWVGAVERLSMRLRLRTPVRLLESARVQVPIVIGSLTPVLLLPASAMTGLSPQQIEAVLAHELAHIRRHDYLVNIVQSLVETVLFYHPAVWWVSHMIRVEREHCCDDLAVSVCGDAVLYARALTDIETRRHERIGVAMAVSSGSLLSRVRRLLGVRAPARLAASGWVVLSLTAILVASAGLAGGLKGVVQRMPPFAEPAEAAVVGAEGSAMPQDPALPNRVTPPVEQPPADTSVQGEAEQENAAIANEMHDAERAVTRALEDAQRQVERSIRDSAEGLDTAMARDDAMREVERGMRHGLENAQQAIERAGRLARDDSARAASLAQVDAITRQFHEQHEDIEQLARQLAERAVVLQRGVLDASHAELNAAREQQTRAMREQARQMANVARQLAEQVRAALQSSRSLHIDSSDQFGPPPPPPPSPAAPASPAPPAPPAPAVQPAPPPPPAAAPRDVPTPPAPPRAAAQSVPATPAPPAPPAPPAAAPQSVPAPPAPPVPPRGDVSMNSAKGSSWSVVRTDNGKTLKLQGKGRIEFTDDDSDLKSIEPGGRFVFETSNGWFSWFDACRFEAIAGKDGSIARTYTIDGRTVPDAEGRAWLARTLPEVVRELAIGADTRVARILARSGADGVLAEIGRIKNGWARHVYFVQLFEQANLDSATLAHSLRQAGEQVDSDFARAVVLKKAAERFPLDNATGAAYADASRTIESDYEARHALGAALTQPGVSGPIATHIVTAAIPHGTAGIDSDYEMAELLQQVPPALAAAVGQVYIDAIASIGSDYERKRVLSTMARRPGLDASGVTAVATLTDSMRSDYERAEVLLVLARNQRLDGPPKDAVVKAAERIGSDYERGRVLAAVR